MKALVVALALLVSASAEAQPVVVLTGAPVVEFTPSPDHAVLKLDGITPVVTNYELNVIAMNSTGAIAMTIGLQKPTPNAANLIIVPVTQLNTLTPNVRYTAVVKAVGPDGAGASDPFGPFGRAAPQVPGKPTNVKVR